MKAIYWFAVLGGFWLGYGGMALLNAQPAPSANPTAAATPFCPADRPHRLEIETGTMSCTSPSCLGRMDCGSGTCKISRDLGDHCNTCMMRTYVACLSEQDLKAIRR